MIPPESILQMSRFVDMLICVRTTLNLSDGLVAEARAYARKTGRTLTSVLEEALRQLLASQHEPRDPVRPLPAYGEPDGRFLVDLADRDAVWAELDEDRRS